MNDLRLITIPMSHYCEKTRWGLERLGLTYREERHLQVFHYPRTYQLSRGPNVPVLVDGDRVVSDSTLILKHLERYAAPGMTLYPDDPAQRAQVEELEDLFDEVMGVESRRWVYFHFSARPLQALRIAGQGVPAAEKLLAPLIYPLFRLLIHTLLKPTSARVEAGLQQVRGIVRRTDALLAQGQRYLLGPRFTAADLALACMMAPLVLPRNYGIRLPEVEELSPAARATVREFRSTETGGYVLRLFAEEKPSP
ncbi:MAG: glutathione S-transferase family protein [Thiogranum sp.]|nr:glutathione S-transferase family protein [Thiogranum sp.]